jgi:hypothetical protein
MRPGATARKFTKFTVLRVRTRVGAKFGRATMNRESSFGSTIRA